MNRAAAGAAVLVMVALLGRSAGAQLGNTFTNWIEHPAIAYRSHPVTDPIAALNRDLRADPLRLKFEGPSGYLRSTLDALRVPIESQIALFGQDSLQRERISTLNPRAIFFNDTVSVAWVRGGFIEVASQDPQQGVVFYVLDNVREDKPQFTRREDCLSCHYSFSTVGVPGMLDQGSRPDEGRSHHPARTTLGRLVRHGTTESAPPFGQPCR